MRNIFLAMRRRPLAVVIRTARVILAAGPALLWAPAAMLSAPALAQTKHNIEGTPLDTLAKSHLKADVPEAKDFVKSSRTGGKDLDYTPLTGSEPVRPKPLDPAGVKALQAELESAGAKNAQRAKGLLPVKRADTGKGKSPKSAK